FEEGEIQGFDHFDKAGSFKVDRTVEEVSPDDYDALLLPGGVGNPDILRLDENAVQSSGVRRAGQAGGCDLPRAVDARLGARRAVESHPPAGTRAPELSG